MLEILEATLSFVPSSTSQKQMIDISLYDHVKITAAIGSCIYEYMKENNETDYEKILYKQAKEFYQKKTFLLYSLQAIPYVFRTLPAKGFVFYQLYLSMTQI